MTLVWVWTALALVGALVNLGTLVDALADRRWLHWSHLNGNREIVARTNIRGATISTAIQGMFLGLGLMIVFTGRPVHRDPVTIRSLVSTVVLLATEVLLVIGALLDRHDRQRLLDKLEPTEGGK